MDGFAAAGFGLLALLVQSLQTSYLELPLRELKRRATRDREDLRRLMSVAHYQTAARVFLEFLKFIFTALGVVAISRTFDLVKALLLIALLFSVLKILSIKKFGLTTWLAVRLSPALAWLVRHVDTFTKKSVRLWPVKKVIKVIKKRSPNDTDIYEKEDFQDFIRHQTAAPNNRIPEAELEAALHAMDFSVSKVKDLMVKKRNIHFVNIKDPIGPILLSELHKSGYSCFPVQGNSENEVVGMLSLAKVAQHTSGGVVADAMDENVYYVQSDQGLEHVLQAFAQTGSSMFIVVNPDAELAGLITVNNVLEQIVGKSTLYNDFEDYSDPRLVAQGQQGESPE